MPSDYTLKNRIIYWAVIGVPIVLALVMIAAPYLGGGMDFRSILGAWDAAETGQRVTFHENQTIDIASLADRASAASQGVYFTSTDGMVMVKMKDGRAYTAFFREISPNQFDLVEKQTGHVVEFRRAR